MDYDEWGRLLERFAPSDPSEAEPHWADVKRLIPIGHSVTGEVFARAPFGAWVDLDIGFPALLEIVHIADLTPERSRAGDWCPIGSQVTAFVGGFNDNGHQIGLKQVELGWWRSASEPA